MAIRKFKEEFSVWQDEDSGDFFAEQNEAKALKEIKLAVRRPTHLEKERADFEYNKKMNKLLQEGIMPRIKLEEVIRANGIWNDEKEKQSRQLTEQIGIVEGKLRKGGIKVSEMARLAKENIKHRFDWLNLVGDKNQIMNNSAESISDNHKFNYLVSCCTVYNNDEGKCFFKNYDEYLKQDNLGNPVTTLAGIAFSRLNFDMDSDFRKDWFEYKLLKKHGFVNDKMQYINKDGEVIDEDGNVMKKPEDPLPLDFEPEFLPD